MHTANETEAIGRETPALHAPDNVLPPALPPTGRRPTTRRTLVLLGAGSIAAALSFIAATPVEWDRYDLAVATCALVGIAALIVYRLVDLVAYFRRLAGDATRSSARLAAILDATPLPVRVLDADGTVLLANKAADEWNASGLLGGERDGYFDELRRRGLDGERFEGVEVSLGTVDGKERQAHVWTAPISAEGQEDAIVAVFADVTEQRQREERVRFLADHDPLTGLLNRRGFHSRLDAAVADAEESSILAILDIDNFKLVNDSAGHPVGDAVLVGIAHELASALRADDVLARLSGDEFAILIRPGGEHASAIVDRLLNAVRKYRLVTTETSISVTTSIGVYELVPGTNPKEALARADAALYEAKEQGRNRVVVWNDAHDQSALRAATRSWAGQIERALDERRFVTYLQPIVELASGRVVQHEALARLQKADGSVALPGAFIPPAGRLGLMPAIDRAMLENVVELLAGDSSLRISMNLDAASFEDDALLDRLEEVLVGAPELAGRLGIEITEHTTLRDSERAQRRLTRLKELRCDLSIDDFGTGFASFEHLREVPADVVKISHNLVDSVDSDPTSAALVEAIVTVAHALGKDVTAEGVERPEVAAVLRALHIEYAQGYFFGRPAPAGSALAPDAGPTTLGRPAPVDSVHAAHADAA